MGEFGFEYRLERSRRRTIGISVGPDGVSVKAPTNLPLHVIEGFIAEKSRWIMRRLEEHERSMDAIERSGHYVSTLPYLGGDIPMEIREAASRERIKFEDGRFIAFVKSRDRHSVEKVYSSWLRKHAKEFLEQRVSAYEEAVGASPSRISVRNQKTRWGSAASRTGTLSFNLNLLKAPSEIVDYVVVHELSHLVVHNHSKKFWRVVESVVPDYKMKIKWLKKNGLSLMRF